MITSRVVGDGPPVLLVHGAAEDAAMLAGQAEALAARGRRVITYDRRGTGASTRANWPDGGVAQHAADAAALLRAHAAAPATVLGFSSGGIVAMALAVRHPELIAEAIAWEPPLLSLLPDGLAIQDGMVAPIRAYLGTHPDDWSGAFAVMIEVISDGGADLDSPEAKAQMVNAEAAIRDDAEVITRHVFAAGELSAAPVTVAVGGQVSPLHVAIADAVAATTGRAPLVVAEADDHEVYVKRPEVLAAALGGRR